MRPHNPAVMTATQQVAKTSASSSNVAAQQQGAQQAHSRPPLQRQFQPEEIWSNAQYATFNRPVSPPWSLQQQTQQMPNDKWMTELYFKKCTKMANGENQLLWPMFRDDSSLDVLDGLRYQRPQDLFLRNEWRSLIENGRLRWFNRRRDGGDGEVYSLGQ